MSELGGLPVGIRGTELTGLMVDVTVFPARGATMKGDVLVPSKESTFLGIATVALPGKFELIPLAQLVPLIKLQGPKESEPKGEERP